MHVKQIFRTNCSDNETANLCVCVCVCVCAKNDHNILARYTVKFNKAEISLVKKKIKGEWILCGSLLSLPEDVNIKVKNS